MELNEEGSFAYTLLLSSQSLSDILDEIDNLPQGVTAIHLKVVDEKYGVADLEAIFKRINDKPAITFLDFKCIHPVNFKAEYAPAFQRLHHITDLDLTNNFVISSLTTARVRDFFSRISHVKNISIEGAGLGYYYQYKSEQFIEALSGLYEPVTLLNLGKNQLNLQTAEALREGFGKFPRSLTHINLCFNDLFLFGRKFAKVVDGLYYVTHINLKGNLLGNIADTYLSESFAAFREPAVYIDFNDNCLGFQKAPAFADAVSKLQFATQLNLENNAFKWSTAAEYRTAFSGFKGTKVYWLKLSNNDFETKTPEFLKEAFDFPENITELDFSNSNLYKLSPKQLIDFLESIPRHVKKINISNNALFTYRSPQERRTLIEALKQSDVLKRLELSGNDASSEEMAELKNHVLKKKQIKVEQMFIPGAAKLPFFGVVKHLPEKATEPVLNYGFSG